MRDEHKTKEQLINELVELRQRIAELETPVRHNTGRSETECLSAARLTVGQEQAGKQAE